MYGHAGGGDSSAEPQAVEPAWYETGNNVTTTQLLGSKRWQSASVWSYDGLLTRLTMMRENGMPPMQLMPASRLEGLGEIPRSDQNHAVDAIEAVKSCGRDAENKPKAVLVMFSHRCAWLVACRARATLPPVAPIAPARFRVSPPARCHL